MDRLKFYILMFFLKNATVFKLFAKATFLRQRKSQNIFGY